MGDDPSRKGGDPVITTERIEATREAIREFEALNIRAVSLSDYLMTKFSCSRQVADRLIVAERQNLTTLDVRRNARRMN